MGDRPKRVGHCRGGQVINNQIESVSPGANAEHAIQNGAWVWSNLIQGDFSDSVINGPNVAIGNVYRNAATTSTGDVFISVWNTDDCLIIGNYAPNPTFSTAMYYSGNSTDARFVGNTRGSFDVVGTRTRWNGVIGGGPLGGVDTDAIADADVSEGDEAVSNTVDEVLVRFDGSNWKAQGTVSGTYTGDGTATQSVALGFEPEWVAIEEASGDYEILRRGMSRAVLAGSSMPGSFSLTASGFDVGNGTGDQDPNTNSETYNFAAG